MKGGRTPAVLGIIFKSCSIPVLVSRSFPLLAGERDSMTKDPQPLPCPEPAQHGG